MIRKLFSANPARIGRFDGPPMSDAVPASLVDGTPGDLKADLIALLGKENVLHRAIDLVRYASDASPYRLVPQVVVLPRTTDDIVKLFRYCRETGRHATFRAAGTSLNGQSQSDDILIDVRRHWYGGKVEDDGRRVRARPGMILGHINSMLERHGRRLGPDPASSHACTIGGVIANNAGGMRCTVQKDAYHTVSALTFVTPSGAVIDTSRPDAEKAVCAGRAAACGRLARAAKRASGRSGAGGPYASQVRDQEHARIAALCTSRRRNAARDFSTSPRRLGGYTRVHR